ncbi:MAG: hypothetical protein QF736_00265, partial [Candidatus Thalassarchaeaceae archaeon]|nr:hypothetical protein [Candidatus Thalassarchaeaceae archaeon]
MKEVLLENRTKAGIMVSLFLALAIISAFSPSPGKEPDLKISERSETYESNWGSVDTQGESF